MKLIPPSFSCSRWLPAVGGLCLGLGAWQQAAAVTALGVGEPSPAAGVAAQVPVSLSSDVAAVALQADVQFNDALYTVSDALAGTQPDGVQVQSRVVEPGLLRVVVFHRSSGAMGNEVVFKVPLTAKAGVVADDPVVITNIIVAGQGGGALSTTLMPKVRLLGLRDNQRVNGRQGVELTVNATATAGTITKVEYYVGGVLVGEGAGANFSYLWQPGASGPFEITAVAYDSNGLIASTRTIPVIINHVGTYVGPVLGSYFGLVRGSPFSFANDGYVTMTSTVTGNFTLKMLAGGKTYTGSGKFSTEGNATLTISRGKNITPLTVVLAHSSTPPVDQIHGRVADGPFANGKFTGNTFATEFTVDRLVWNTRTRPAPQNGAYTLLLPAADDAATAGAPLGAGHGTVTVGKDGTAKLAGSLADGTAVTASSWLSKDGVWPVYASLYANKGVMLGNVEYASTPGVSDMEGALTWMRSADAKAALFKPGFTTTVDAVGARYTKPAALTRMIPLKNVGGNLSLFLTDGGLTGPIERLATLTAANTAVVPLQDADQSTLAFTAATGLFSGSFFHPVTQAKLTFKGAVLQPQGLFSGYFLAGTQGGGVTLSANDDFPPAPADAGALGVAPLPVVRVTTPAANSTLKAVVGNVVQVKGTATDKQGITSVQVQVLHNGVLSAPAAATGTTAWTFDIPVPADDGGHYAVFVSATDGAGHKSEVATTQFWAPLKSGLTVAVSGPGKVTNGFLGVSQRDVGKLVTLTATPNAKKKFLGWSGSVSSTSPKLTILMKAGTSLQANFGD